MLSSCHVGTHTSSKLTRAGIFLSSDRLRLGSLEDVIESKKLVLLASLAPSGLQYTPSCPKQQPIMCNSERKVCSRITHP